MAPGFFKKIGNFFKKVWDGTKQVFQKIAPVVKTVLPFLAPIIPGGPATTTLITKGIDIGEKIIGNNSANASNVSPEDRDRRSLEERRSDVAERMAQGKSFLDNTARKMFGGMPIIARSQAKVPTLDSPRIKLKL